LRHGSVWVSALSSDPFSQSGSPSHCHLFDSAHVFFTQVLSSLPSEQSSSLLHFQSKRIQRPLLHGNWDSSHFALAPSAAVHRQARASSRQSALQRAFAVMPPADLDMPFDPGPIGLEEEMDVFLQFRKNRIHKAQRLSCLTT
uniref:Uncharacterized protein n=1 Tax=Anas platyrhynchos platyrhynchos TaxID=8840 RepID=A0A493SZD4_ANAPP